jgi:hypothetical protein
LLNIWFSVLPLRGSKILALAGYPGKTLFNTGYRPRSGSHLNGYALWRKAVWQDQPSIKILKVAE